MFRLTLSPIVSLAFGVAVFAIVGCAEKRSQVLLPVAQNFRTVAPAPEAPRELAKVLHAPYVVEPGDVLLVQPADLDSPVRFPADQPVLADGTIDLSPYGRPLVANKTLPDIENQINELLRSKLPNAEKIAINVRLAEKNSKVYYVLGEVKNPGAYTHMGYETALDAILTAGGLTCNASQDEIVLSRPTAPCEKRDVKPICYRHIVQLGDTTTNYQIMPGDRIYVPSRSWRERFCPGGSCFHKPCGPCNGWQALKPMERPGCPVESPCPNAPGCATHPAVAAPAAPPPSDATPPLAKTSRRHQGSLFSKLGQGVRAHLTAGRETPSADAGSEASAPAEAADAKGDTSAPEAKVEPPTPQAAPAGSKLRLPLLSKSSETRRTTPTRGTEGGWGLTGCLLTRGRPCTSSDQVVVYDGVLIIGAPCEFLPGKPAQPPATLPMPPAAPPMIPLVTQNSGQPESASSGSPAGPAPSSMLPTVPLPPVPKELSLPPLQLPSLSPETPSTPEQSPAPRAVNTPSADKEASPREVKAPESKPRNESQSPAASTSSAPPTTSPSSATSERVKTPSADVAGEKPATPKPEAAKDPSTQVKAQGTPKEAPRPPLNTKKETSTTAAKSTEEKAQAAKTPPAKEEVLVPVPLPRMPLPPGELTDPLPMIPLAVEELPQLPSKPKR